MQTTNLVMPADLNPSGFLFGGKILAEMDKIGAIVASEYVRCRVVTLKISEVLFKVPISKQDVYTLEAKVVKAGNTSITVHIDVFKKQYGTSDTPVLATTAEFIYVSVNEDGIKVYHEKPMP